ncbi:MAG TPA: hypothetical protein VM223_00125, partial [Planctomycetota bacterium]|nr:hypothetical protein [Planctomycetota bacterium]
PGVAAIMVILAFAAWPAHAQQLNNAPGFPVIDFGAFWWEPSLEGKVGFPTRIDGADNELDLRQDLQFKPTVDVPVAKLHVFVSDRWLLRLEYWQRDQEADSILARSVVFGSVRFPAGERVTSSFTARNADLIAAYEIPLLRKLSISVAGGINVFSYQQRISGRSGSDEFSIVQTSGLLGLAGEWALSDRFGLWSCSMGSFDKGIAGDQFLIRTDTALLVRILKRIRFSIGYRSFWFGGKGDGNSLHFEQMGPYAGFTAGF